LAPPDREAPDDRVLEDPPPLLSSWRNLYVLVLVELGLVVAVFYALTRWAAS